MVKLSENIKVRKAAERGAVDLGWLKSYHSFSFGDYYDPQHMGYRTLRVINDDLIAAKGGFGMHPHRDMEIISYVVQGQLEHKDSMGNGSIIEAGNVQKMSAGTGVTHSEFNPSPTQSTRLLQIWILPKEKGIKPSYQEIQAKNLKARNGLILIASDEDNPHLVRIYQDVKLFLGRFHENQKVNYVLRAGRGIWIQMIQGALEVNGIKLQQGDGASIEQEANITIQTSQSAEFLLFDLA